ncbi:craniofacial development protein 2-like [Nilaparvata lugens]|uniref:craniofacial development protein 2-like n=1 Tax=Nilaparvata lugens TaxID=108931 RepID=UPI00193CC179|nr:craniofacial development protein 2-like [Nilaparvata lugens]
MALFVNDSGGKTSFHLDLWGRISRGHQKLHRKERMHIETWNVRTLLQAGKLENAKQKMKRNRLDVMGMCEMRWEGNGELVSGDYKLFYSGEEKQGQHGVGVLLGPRVKDKVRRVDYIDGRLMMVRLEGSEKDLVIVQTYMPTSQYDEEQVDQCFGRMEEIIE